MKNNILAGIYTLFILSGLSLFFWAVFHYEILRTYIFYISIALFGILWVIHPLWVTIRIKLEQKDLDEFKED